MLFDALLATAPGAGAVVNVTSIAGPIAYFAPGNRSVTAWAITIGASSSAPQRMRSSSRLTSSAASASRPCARLTRPPPMITTSCCAIAGKSLGLVMSVVLRWINVDVKGLRTARRQGQHDAM